MINKIIAFLKRLFNSPPPPSPTPPTVTTTPPVIPQTITHSSPSPSPVLAPTKYLWNTPKNARHSVRVICDEERLSLAEKNKITAVIHAESGFYNSAKNVNIRPDGSKGSTDWGICQINDRFHIGKGKTFPSVDYVLKNPDKVVRWMIRMYKKGNLNWWIAYKNGSYKKYL